MNTPDNAPDRQYRVDFATVRADWPLFLLLAIDFGYGLVSLPMMPAEVPTHWGLSGAPDQYGPAWVNALVLPAIGLLLYLSLLALPLIDPLRRNYALFTDTLRFVRWLLVLFAIGLHVVVVRVSLDHAIEVDFAVRLGVALLIVALGNRMGTMRRNFFIGIRVPWTLSSEEVWNRTHRMAGRLWVVGGIGLVAAAFLPAKLGMTVFTTLIVILVAVPVLYSWRLYRRIANGA